MQKRANHIELENSTKVAVSNRLVAKIGFYTAENRPSIIWLPVHRSTGTGTTRTLILELSVRPRARQRRENRALHRAHRRARRSGRGWRRRREPMFFLTPS